ncbi:uncharacterized protein VICG_00896 [Vittaforma corneae ATCC 50505]|uniref:Uncharacterized protein n=1 Tax=Vittaforma corneae (strain ATCC 50505) TaxID=993615 RepID=L2GNZ9_VITCO|nr:uncharacterized protein VICG_00896 [Vittaforma corneae ATCC 50505]ELA42047.1 hypothetical protein VICG_00896 [Vittaforma corneae ATCC 50505]
MNFGEDAVVLKNLSKENQSIPKNKTLIKAIENSDISFLQELLVSDSRFEDISGLSKFYKCKLLPLLTEFLDQPLRLEAIQCIYEIMTDTGNIDAFSKTLIDRSVDFNKLVFLKGKIDYLKYLQRSKAENKAENEHVEQNQ